MDCEGYPIDREVIVLRLFDPEKERLGLDESPSAVLYEVLSRKVSKGKRNQITKKR